MNTKTTESNRFGEEIMSNHAVTKSVKQMKNALYGVGVAITVLAGGVWYAVATTETPRVLEKETGQIITHYEHGVDKLSLEERMAYAAQMYRGLRQRTGIAPVDTKALEGWGEFMTRGGALAWQAMGSRWQDLSFVQPGKLRLTTVTNARPDRVNPYAYVIEAHEVEGMRDDPRSDAEYRVRFTMFYTDPAVTGGTSKLDSIVMHEEEKVK